MVDILKMVKRIYEIFGNEIENHKRSNDDNNDEEEDENENEDNDKRVSSSEKCNRKLKEEKKIAYTKFMNNQKENSFPNLFLISMTENDVLKTMLATHIVSCCYCIFYGRQQKSIDILLFD